jgi:16S rRNA (guanine527-N7)-methyltransferase
MHPYFDLIPTYFPELSKNQLHRFSQLWDFYHDWNAKINLISRKDIDELYLRHVLHSLSIAKVFQFKPNTRILDVGTGGGFPGIPLAIFFEEHHFVLIDSIGKKIRVVEEAIKMLELQNAEAMQIRAEDIDQRFDVVVSRAVAQLPQFISWVSGSIVEGNNSGIGNGIIYLKGGDLEEELKQVVWKKKIYDIPDFYEEAFFDTKKVVHLRKE